MNTIKIKNKYIGKNYPVFFIAEAGVNHNGSVKLGKRLIDIAVQAGADAVKFQNFIADEIILPKAPKSKYHIETTGSDKKQTWMQLLKTQEISREMLDELIEYSNKKRIIFLSTPYDEKSADLLEEFDMPAYKIASTDTNNFKLLEHISRKNKPIILSTAMCTEQEVISSVNFLKNKGVKQLAVMHCTGSYPTQSKDSNLKVINKFNNLFSKKCLIGYSDHTENFINPVVATSLGVNLYEKHFTISKKLKGPDHRMSLSPKELKRTVNLIRQTEIILGNDNKRVLNSEKENRKKLRKSIVTVFNLKKNQKILFKHLTAKRPGYGIPPTDFKKIIGKRTTVNIKANKILNKKMFK
jgi:N,N'-diacetyllegionaminate synthase